MMNMTILLHGLVIIISFLLKDQTTERSLSYSDEKSEVSFSLYPTTGTFSSLATLGESYEHTVHIYTRGKNIL